MRVLIVEDNPDDALLLHEAFSGLGIRCAIQVVENAIQVFRHMRETEPDEAPDLAIVDLNLPVIAGHRRSSRARPWCARSVITSRGEGRGSWS